MKKIFMTLIASMLLLSSTTYATESVNHKTHMVQKQAMTKQDMQAVFGTQHVKASSLNNGEMVKTEGEWLGFALRWGWTAAKVGYRNWRYGGRTYARGWHRAHHNFGTRRSPSWRRHYQWNTTHGTYRIPHGRHYPLKYGK